MPSSERLAALATTHIIDRHTSRDLKALAAGSFLGNAVNQLADRSVLIATKSQLAAATALVELDGFARRIVIAPADLNVDHLKAILEDAEVEEIVSDEPDLYSSLGLPISTVKQGAVPTSRCPVPRQDTQWVLLTSGTLGRPKMVSHTLASLTGAIGGAPHDGKVVWSSFYDIRRYGGMQIFLRALLGKTDLVLTDASEPLVDLMRRLGEAGVTAMSGTPSHWRRVVMSHERGSFSPRYVRLSGEVADQVTLDGLALAFPDALMEHVYASTEAGVAFTVADRREGFPASFFDRSTYCGVEMKVVDGTLRIRSKRTATTYLGAAVPTLTDEEGYVDTGDLVELRGDRYRFVGRRGGIINVGGLKVNPEEIEAAIDGHPDVQKSLVRARKSPLTGSIVAVDVVTWVTPSDPCALREDILDACRAKLERYKVPAVLRFVTSLPLSANGKLLRERC